MNQPLITRELLDEFGIKLDDQDEKTFLEHLNATLDERIGAEVTDSLDDEQLKVLLELQENATNEEVGAWIDQNVPELQQITQDEIDILLGEVAENASAVSESSK